jgi:hypothetical protein
LNTPGFNTQQQRRGKEKQAVKHSLFSKTFKLYLKLARGVMDKNIFLVANVFPLKMAF